MYRKEFEREHFFFSFFNQPEDEENNLGFLDEVIFLRRNIFFSILANEKLRSNFSVTKLLIYDAFIDSRVNS